MKKVILEKISGLGGQKTVGGVLIYDGKTFSLPPVRSQEELFKIAKEKYKDLFPNTDILLFNSPMHQIPRVLDANDSELKFKVNKLSNSYRSNHDKESLDAYNALINS